MNGYTSEEFDGGMFSYDLIEVRSELVGKEAA